MDKNKLYLIIGATIILLGVAIYYTGISDSQEDAVSQSADKGSFWKKTSSTVSYTNFPDAPEPESEASKEVSRLWPHALEPKDPNRREKVKKEWQDFARQYPENIYIPQEIREVSLTVEEEKEAIETLDSFTSVDAQYAAFSSANKFATPGSDAPQGPISEKDANPKEMNRYFDYKIRELESRIQLIEYTMEKARLSSIDENIAKADLKIYKKELANLREVQSKIPRS